MITYINGFNLAYDKNSSELIVKFHQTFPSFNEDGNVMEVISEPVSNLIMSKGIAQGLIENIQKLLDDSNNDDYNASNLNKDN